MVLLRHLARLGRDLVGHAVGTRSPWLVLTVALLALTLIVVAASKLVVPVVVYPFL